jgi:hypothetical protein
MNLIVKIIFAHLLILISNVSKAESLCKTNEKVIFSCTVQNGNKLLSVCGTKKLTKTVGYLQYRFGTKSTLELVYPSTTKGTQDKFYWYYLRGSDSAGAELSFNNNGYYYTIGSTQAYDENNGVSSGYIEITKDGKHSTAQTLHCVGKPDENSIIDLYNVVER